MQIFYETPFKYFLLDVNDANISVIAEHTLSDPFESLDNILLLQKGIISDDIKIFLEKNGGDTIYLTDESLIKQFNKIFSNKEFLYDLNLVRTIKENISSFVDLSKYSKELLCISHKLANNKLENKEKMDVIITETLSLIDSLERDINLHVMRIKEWYSNHFPELQDLVSSNYDYLLAVIVVRRRNSFNKMSAEEFAFKIEELKNNVNDEKLKRIKNDWSVKYEEIKKLSESSMGTDLGDNDIDKIVEECKSVLHTFNHKETLVVYLEDKAKSLAPNFVYLLGSVVACKMIYACGTLMALSKKPSSTLQILGAEKSFFEAVKNKENTPKYGYIYNSPLVSQAPPQFKGKIARTLASKAALAAKIDVFGGDESGLMGKKAAENILKRIESLKVVKKKKKMNFN